MPIMKNGDETWELVDADGVVRQIGRAPDTTEGFPRTWRVFGPVGADKTELFMSAYDSTTGFVAQPKVDAPDEALTQLPRQLRIGEKEFEGKDVEMAEGLIDFNKVFEGDEPAMGRMAYAIAEVEFAAATEVILGGGADYWMQWWIDGREVLSTLKTGNMSSVKVSSHCVRHQFSAGKHVIAVRCISGQGSWQMRAGFVSTADEIAGSRQIDRWEMVPSLDLMLPPKGLPQPGLAIRTDLCIADETVSCDFDLHSPEGQFGLVFGAQDARHYYWAYYPRWGQNWRARVFYAVIAKVDETGQARGLAMKLMPNVVAHWNAKLSTKVERRGNLIQMYVNGVKGPLAIDDTYGPGRVGVKGHTDFEVRNFKVEGKPAAGPAWQPDAPRKQVWFNPTKDTGYGTIREASALLPLKNGDVLAGINSRKGTFHDVHQGKGDTNAQTRFYLSSDAGRSWRPHGDPSLTKEMPESMPWGIRWFEPQPGVLRAFHHGSGVCGEQKIGLPSGSHSPLDEPDRAWSLDQYEPERLLTFQDSHDNGLTWGESQISGLVGDWSELYRKPCWNHIYGFTQLRDGTLLTIFLRGFVGIYEPLGNKLTKHGSIGEGTWGTEIAQPYCTRSEDGGLTWQTPVAMDNAAIYDGGVTDSPNGGWSETVFGELPSGRIVALCRPYRSPYSWQTESDDGGRTWRLCCYTSFSTAGGPQMVATDTGCLAVVGRQTGLGLHTSADGGVNWDDGTLLDYDCWFNGFMEKVEPDVALVFYFAPGRGDAEPSLPRMQRLRITADGPVPADG